MEKTRINRVWLFKYIPHIFTVSLILLICIGMWYIPYVYAQRSYAVTQLFSAVKIGIFLCMFLLHISLFLMMHQFKQNLWFSLLCLVWVVRTAVTGRFVFDIKLYQYIPVEWINRYIFASISLTGLLLLLIVYWQYPGAVVTLYQYVLAGIQGLFAIFFMVVSTNVSADFAFLSQIMLFVTSCFVIFLILTAMRRYSQMKSLTPEHVVMLIGFVIAIVSLTYDALYLNYGWFSSYKYDFGEMGVMVFLMFCAAATIIASMRKLADARLYADQMKSASDLLVQKNTMLDQISSMKSVFFQNMSHDFKTPLTVISTSIMNASDLLDFEFDKEEMFESLEIAQHEVMRMARMVDSAMKYTMMEDHADEMRVIDVYDVLRKSAVTYRALLARNGNVLKMNIPEKEVLIMGNTDMLLHMLSNLLSNANRFTKDGCITMSATEANHMVIVNISDNGAGIAPNILNHIWERGVSTGGTGLGLPIAKDAADAHKGEMFIDSEEGVGTSVTCTLPIYHGDARYE